MSQDKPNATFVTFYSFKGGVGRSMALINTAGILAGRGFRVLVIDLDLEAPGLSYLDPNAAGSSPSPEKPRKRPLQLGFVDLLVDVKERGKEADLFTLTVSELAARYTQVYPVPDDLLEFKDGSLHIMPAGLFDGRYAHRLDELNLHLLYEEGLGEPLIRAFKKKFAEAGKYDYVLVDSRTGFSDEAGICTRDLADHLMILSGLNRQNVEGTCEFLKSLRTTTDGNKSFQIILSPVPNGEDALVDQREAAAKTAFGEAWGAKVRLSLQIPYHPQLALTEEPHIFRRRRGYLFDAYRSIERRMLRAIGHDAQTLMEKIVDTLRQRDYSAVLHDLRHLIRLDGGRSGLSQFAANLVATVPRQLLRSDAFTHQMTTLDEIVRDQDGRRLVEFVLDHVPVGKGSFASGPLLSQLIRTAPDLADRLYQRIANAEPIDADMLGSYAVFLTTKRRDMDRAETYFKRAVEADPEHAGHLGNYGLFLATQRGDMAGAETYYQRAIDADPKHVNPLANYGQFLVALGRLPEAEKMLLSAFEHVDPSDARIVAEVCFSLWLVSQMRGHDAERWEEGYKFVIKQGFQRDWWTFDRMLEQAENVLPPEEFEYAKALALAFVDESKVEDLEQCDRWRWLQPVNPRTLHPAQPDL